MESIKVLFTKEKLKTFAILNAGVLFLSLGIYFFKFPNNFATGGVSGISIILSSIFPELSSATLMSVLNILLLIVGLIVLGKEFGSLTAYCSIMFSLETWLFEQLYPMSEPFTAQPLLELVFAMTLPAIGSALLFNSGASSGGTDVIAMILKKYSSLDIGKSLLICDGIIALSTFYFFGVETGLFSILGLFLKAFVVDFVIESVNLCKYFSIVTTESEKISQFIIKELKHGATITDGVGAYTKKEKKVIITACNRSQAVKLRKYAYSVDPKAFIFITNTSEIIGKGFRSF